MKHRSIFACFVFALFLSSFTSAQDTNTTALPLHGAGDAIIANYLNSLRRSYSLLQPGFTLTIHTTQNDEDALGYVDLALTLNGENPVVFAVTNDNILLADPPAPETFLSVPLVAAGFVPALNFPSSLNIALDAKALDDIIAGRIVKWNDPYLRSINPTTSLPDRAVKLFYPSAGTTAQILSHVLLNYGVQSSIENSPFAFASGTTYDVLLSVAANQYSIGISDYATLLRNEWSQMAKLYNKANAIVTVSASTVSEAVKNGPTSLINFIDIANMDGSQSWPWSFYSCITFDTNAQGFCEYRSQLMAFLNWALTNEGAAARAQTFGFAPLSYDLQSNVVIATQSFLCDSKPIVTGQSLVIQGSGATFPALLYTEACYLYRFINPNFLFSYRPIGSSGGIREVTNNVVDFGGTDSPLTAAQVTAGKDLSTFPIVAGAVVMVYNIPGISSNRDLPRLILAREDVADIYLNKITMWNDPRIVKNNPRLADLLPEKRILISHRSDGSGTTFVFTSALSSFSSEFKTKIGAGNNIKPLVPAEFVKPGPGNPGVLAAVVSHEYCIGYVVLGNAMESTLPFADMINKEGKVVSANRMSIEASMAAFPNAPLVFNIMDAPGEDSYPISGYTYVLLRNSTGTCKKIRPILDFMTWMLTSPVSLETAGDLGFAILPKSKSAQVMELMNEIECDGVPAIRNCQSGEIFDSENKECKKCPAGTRAIGLDEPCQTCPNGTYAREGSTSCTACPLNFYSDILGAESCKACPPRSITYITGVKTIENCVCTNRTIPSASSLMNGLYSTLECIEAGALNNGGDVDDIGSEVEYGVSNPPAYYCTDPEELVIGGACVKCVEGHAAGAVIIFLVVIGLCFAASRKNVHSLATTINYLQIASVFSLIRGSSQTEFASILRQVLPANWIVNLFGTCDEDYYFGVVVRIVLPLLPLLLLLGSKHEKYGQLIFSTGLIGVMMFYNEASIEFMKCIPVSGRSGGVDNGDTDDAPIGSVTDSCDSDSYKTIVPLAAIGIIIHIFAVTAYFIRMSIEASKRAHSDHEFFHKHGMLVSRYKHSHEWWEGALAVRRVLIYVLVVDFAEDLHLCVAIVSSVLLVFLAVQLHQQPFNTTTVAFLETFLTVVNICLLQNITMLLHESESSFTTSEDLAYLILFIGIAVAGFVNICEFAASIAPSSQAMFLKDPIAFMMPEIGFSNSVEKARGGHGPKR